MNKLTRKVIDNHKQWVYSRPYLSQEQKQMTHGRLLKAAEKLEEER